MLHVPDVARVEIDAWPIARAGLPARVVNCAERAGLRTVGELRRHPEEELARLPSLGRISLDHIRFFFRLCQEIESGRQVFPGVHELLRVFLDDDEQDVVTSRYGFQLDTTRPSRSHMTLQELGNEGGRTRERVRQVEDVGKTKLQSRIVQTCLQPLYRYFESFIHEQGDVVSPEELAPLRLEKVFSGYNPCGVLMLLHDLQPDRLNFYRGFFTTLPTSHLRKVERAVMRHLEQSARPEKVEDTVRGAEQALRSLSVTRPARVVGTLLYHMDEAASCHDGRHVLYRRGLGTFLREVMESMERPAHYRAITEAFNQRVFPPSRKGAGFILACLNKDPGFQRADRGLYDLA